MKTRAFTLLELLVTIAIISVLAALVFTAAGKARRTGDTAREVSAGRVLMAAYLRHASERDGELLVGYSATESALDDRGKQVPNPACGRYPWRLAPYLDYKLTGSVLVNEQEKIARIQDDQDRVYRTSAHPSFGINATYVGGNERTGLMPTPATIKRYGQFVARRLTHVAQPEKLIVFASSRFTGEAPQGDNVGKGTEAGFHLISPPRTTRVEWDGEYDEDGDAKAFGFLHLRHSGRAVCVMLAGNVELLDSKELRDMRRWSNAAAEADDPEYLLKPPR